MTVLHASGNARGICDQFSTYNQINMLIRQIYFYIRISNVIRFCICCSCLRKFRDSFLRSATCKSFPKSFCLSFYIDLPAISASGFFYISSGIGLKGSRCSDSIIYLCKLLDICLDRFLLEFPFACIIIQQSPNVDASSVHDTRSML